MFESSGSGKRGRGLELVYRYLLSIPLSSVDAEKSFPPLASYMHESGIATEWQNWHAVFSALLLSEEQTVG